MTGELPPGARRAVGGQVALGDQQRQLTRDAAAQLMQLSPAPGVHIAAVFLVFASDPVDDEGRSVVTCAAAYQSEKAANAAAHYLELELQSIRESGATTPGRPLPADPWEELTRPAAPRRDEWGNYIDGDSDA